MDAARQEIQQGAAEGTVIIAGEQTEGKGRRERQWLSPTGNIALSIILYPDIKAVPYLIMVASIAAGQSIEAISGRCPQIKWPNDILVDGKKVCGILIENEVKGNNIAFSIIGIGINVDLNVADYPEIANTAASMKPGPGKGDLRVKIIRSLLIEFEKLYCQLPDGKIIFEAWRNKLITLGKKVRAKSGNQIIEGIAESVDESGALMIRQSDGRLTREVAGDVTLQG